MLDTGCYVTAVNTNKNVQRYWHSAGGGIIYLLYMNGDGERKKGEKKSCKYIEYCPV